MIKEVTINDYGKQFQAVGTESLILQRLAVIEEKLGIVSEVKEELPAFDKDEEIPF